MKLPKLQLSKKIHYFLYLTICLFFTLLTVNIVVAFATATTEYRKALREDLVLSVIPLSVPLLISLILYLFVPKAWNNLTLIVGLFFIGVTIVLQYQIYSDWLSEPKQISGKLISVESTRQYGRRVPSYGLKFNIEGSDEIWFTKPRYSKSKLPYFISQFEENLGRNITIAYSPNYRSIITVQSGDNFIYKLSDICMKFKSKDNYCK